MLLLTLSLVPFFTFGQPFQNVTATQNIAVGYGDGYDIFAGGVSFCDFNQDGWEDLTFSTAIGEPLHFYVNQEGSFVKIDPLIPDTMDAKQVLWVDIDNDGDKDLFVANAYSPNKLYENDGSLNLTDISEAAGLMPLNDPTYGVTFGDYDRDGWLDLYITNRSLEGLLEYPNFLLKNNGVPDGGGSVTFDNVTSFSGTSDGIQPSFCAAFLDYDQDGWSDIFIANDRFFASNSLYKNNGDGTFENVTIAANMEIYINAMNVGVGDYDNDHDLDIYVTNTPFGNKMLKNNNDGTFDEVAEDCGTAFYRTGWGGNFFDFDNDTDLDLYVSAMEELSTHPNALYFNNGDGTFTEELTNGLPGDTVRSFANAIADFDHDGWLDIIVHNGAQYESMLWQNVAQNGNHWLKIELEGTESNRDGIGSWIEVFAGGEKWIRYTHCGIAYLAQNSSQEHIGLGGFEMVDSILVHWTSGVVDNLKNVPADQIVKIVEGETLTALNSTNILAESARIFPNPTTGELLFLEVELTNATRFNALIYNVLGEVVFEKEVQFEAGKNVWQLPNNSFSNGVYELILQEENGSHLEMKFVVNQF